MAVIFHIDINAFYASAHILYQPELTNKPLVVCSNRRGSVVTTASYEARSFGIESAMPLAQAKKLCDHLEIVDVDFELYSELSGRFINIIRTFSTYVQQASIDECYVDVTQAIKEFKKPLDLAIKIQQAVYEELKLPISIGVAPNKFLAKMASDMRKPNGITILRIREVEEKMWPMDIALMHGVGQKTVPKLRALSINTIGDLAKQDSYNLKHVLGNNSERFIDKANGIDLSPIILDSAVKSVGQSKTFPLGMSELEEIITALETEIKEVSSRLKKNDLVGRTVSFSIRLENYLTATRSITLDNATSDEKEIFERVMDLYDEFDGISPVVFLSVSMSNLIDREQAIEQINIFEDSHANTINEMIVTLNKKIKGGNFKTPRDLLNEGKS